jgi:hypothetical protein
MKRLERSVSRREALTGLIVLPALAGFLASIPMPAAAKGSKAQFKYQSTPKNGQKCSGCKFFTAGKTPTASGTCAVVDGSISPNGWCTAYTAKS